MAGYGKDRRAQFGQNIQQTYDAVACEYANEIYGELAHKPFDREILDRFAARVRGRGLVGDFGCGPAQIARYLRDRGVNAFGLDFSAGMLAQAQRLNPNLAFVQTSILDLGLGTSTLAGIAAFYSIIHIPRERMVVALREMHRVLRPGGVCLLTFHLGSEDSYHDELFGQKVELDVALFTAAEMTGYLQAAGLLLEEAVERDPYAPEVEYQSRRGYILAVRT
ncbi:MAG TPA: class I SAM-dependent methyltransferase [Terriglobales bacterium]|nr:class I SAM-dependent methyltransferase [Terriglobales bacterium]